MADEARARWKSLAIIMGAVAALITALATLYDVVWRNSPVHPSPLFLRFAIEQAAIGPLGSTDRLDMVLDYVEALRAGRVDLSASDMVRAASVAALEAAREDGVPREVDLLHLRGVLQSAADRLPFMDTDNVQHVEPAAVIDCLLASGLLNLTRSGHRVQFAYDPVAEFLAARWLRDTPALETLREALLATDTPVGDVYREIVSPAPAPEIVPSQKVPNGTSIQP